MASVNDRWHIRDRGTGKTTRSSRYGQGKRWQVRYRDPDGQSRNRSFDRRVDADRFRVEVEHQLSRGGYVDERSGRVLFADYAADWLARQIQEPTSLQALEVRLRVHMLPTWGPWPLAKITPSAVQRWVVELHEGISAGYVRLILVNFGAILRSAVDEGILASSPVASSLVRAPAIPPRKVTPWNVERLLSVTAQLPPRWRPLAAVAAGCGLRQGEAFGLRVHDIDFDRQVVHVRQQIRLEDGRPVPALPKYRRTRSVPLPSWVGEQLEASTREHAPLGGERSDRPGLGGLLFYTRERKPLNRNYFNPTVWRPALLAAGVPNDRDNGMHALRHTCASLWLEHGVSIKAVSEYLGHADPGFTLRVYTHVMPSSGDKARRAMDAALGRGGAPTHAGADAGAPWAHETVTEGGH
ncbi:tyrosine-type recombinase/integrase [Nocardioides sp. Leaf285]|uniref:tyrosine-type recombinase/integrase n=1 Tax=Nocardioides sp. Leaf285 TaxID=1736322 RepID=UPI00070381A7|nr:site-specific integrase [Nocardioides sp. Leaf285]KQP66904.1 hypothetical protein ASF47_04145 [Nocardioides sp. Leaf285]